MPEQEPLYFKTFREYVELRFDSLESHVDRKIETEVGNLAAITAKNFDRVYQKINDLDNRMNVLDGRVENIEAYIGRAEIRSKVLLKR